MKHKSSFKHLPQPFLFFLLVVTALFSCESHGFDSDKRQLLAKDAIQEKLHKAHSFDITSFKEDTLELTDASNFEKAIRYTLNIAYLDSNSLPQKKKGIVLFTPDGKSIISSEIIDN